MDGMVTTKMGCAVAPVPAARFLTVHRMPQNAAFVNEGDQQRKPRAFGSAGKDKVHVDVSPGREGLCIVYRACAKCDGVAPRRPCYGRSPGSQTSGSLPKVSPELTGAKPRICNAGAANGRHAGVLHLNKLYSIQCCKFSLRPRAPPTAPARCPTVSTRAITSDARRLPTAGTGPKCCRRLPVLQVIFVVFKLRSR